MLRNATDGEGPKDDCPSLEGLSIMTAQDPHRKFYEQ